jgi:phosphoribosyl-ATP pyrophosphohydrolase
MKAAAGSDATLDRLVEVLQQRRSADPEKSYVARLYRDGLDAILKKIGEEATETVIAAKSGSREQVVHEVADLWFHTLVMLIDRGLSHQDVLSELDRRFGISGLTEKAARKQ